MHPVSDNAPPAYRTCRTSVFAGSCLVGLAALVFADHRPSVIFSRAGLNAEDPLVYVHVFDSEGRLVGPVESPRLTLTDRQWRERLTREQYQVLRGKGTETAFCGTLLHNHEPGVYTCVGCGLPLFSSDDKYDSGTGWPSFFQPIAPGNVVEFDNFNIRTMGVEITCAVRRTLRTRVRRLPIP